MTRPYFSVVIPVYNAGDRLRDTVRSVLDQTESDFDLWLIDDGSTDDSLSVMRELVETDDRIRAISKNNGGVSSARNLGAELSRGRFIAFLDADDLWQPEKLAAHRALHAADPRVYCSYGQIAFMAEDESCLDRARTVSTVPEGALRLEQVLGENPVCTGSNIVVSRECFEHLGGFARAMNYAEDQEWLARLVSGGFRIVGIDSLLVGYRMSPGGLSSDLEAMHDGWTALADKFEGLFDRSAAEALFCRYLSRRALRNGASPLQALRFACQGLRRDYATFLNDVRRGSLTVAAACVSPFMPRPVRVRVFS